MNCNQREELVNAARCYERFIVERQTMFVLAIGHKREGREDEWVAGEKAYWESKNRAMKVERILAERIYGLHDFIRVDNVVYMAYSTETLLRIPLDYIPDIAKEIDRVGSIV